MVTWRPLRMVYLAALMIVAGVYLGPLGAILVALATIDVVAS